MGYSAAVSAAKTAGFPLRPTLVSMIVLLILAGTGAVGVLAYHSTQRSIDTLWQELSGELAQRTTQRTIRFLEPAVPYARLTERLAEGGHLDAHDVPTLLDYFHGAMEANHEFTWVSHGDDEGTYVAVQREADGSLLGHHREQDEEAGGGRLRTLRRQGGEWRVVSEEPGAYDPRQRPWYRAGHGADGGMWVEPFVFATMGVPGFMYVAPHRSDGATHGVWAVEYEMSSLSEFLATVEVGEHGKVYVVSEDGLVVGHPEGVTTRGSGGDAEIAMAGEHGDAFLSEAWQGLAAHPERPASFLGGENLVMADAFPEASGIPWQVVIVVPEEDYFGTLQEQALRAAMVAALAALLAVLAGVFLANRVSASLRVIADELGRIGRFELEGPRLPRNSLVREVNDMAEATDAMKSSLKSFGRYVPKGLVSEMLRTGTEAELGGQMEDLTMLFSDIAGFTSIAETLEPDVLVEQLAEYLETMSGAVQENRGTVDKFIGDAIMAFWGAPRPLEDHAVHACRAALAMRAVLARNQVEWEKAGRPLFDTRIGINSGTTLVGNIGAKERLNYTVMGDAVNLASRLENLNKAYGTRILCGDETVKRAGDGFVFRPVDWVAVKGKSRGILIHELVGEATDVDAETKAAVDAYRHALDIYRDRRFDEAAAAFDAADAAFGGADGPSKTLAARARKYEKVPPPEGWDGTYVMTSK